MAPKDHSWRTRTTHARLSDRLPLGSSLLMATVRSGAEGKPNGGPGIRLLAHSGLT